MIIAMIESINQESYNKGRLERRINLSFASWSTCETLFSTKFAVAEENFLTTTSEINEKK
jgi:hypothetical protein